MSDRTPAPLDTSDDLTLLSTQLKSGTEKTQLQVIPQLAAAGTSGETILQDFLLERRSQPPTPIDGKMEQILLQGSPTAQDWLKTHFPTGVVPLRSDHDLDYTALQQALATQDFLTADRLTYEKLCQLAGTDAIQRKWVYFTEVKSFPVTDLRTLNQLWIVYSEGKFGFSVQRELWLALGRNWEKLWSRIGWHNEQGWTRYPQEFTWDLSAPRGHLPLSNQLRGVQMITALFAHPAWDSAEA